MKYFTPDLLLQFQSEDPKVSDNAADAWERAQKNYSIYLRRISTRLPKGFQLLRENYYLHDATVYGMGRGRPHHESMQPIVSKHLSKSDFSVILRPENDRKKGLLLIYKGVVEVDLVDHPALAQPPARYQWLYDEIKIDKQAAFKHSILLTGGIEVAISFRDLQIEPFAASQLSKPASGRKVKKELQLAVA